MPRKKLSTAMSQLYGGRTPRISYAPKPEKEEKPKKAGMAMTVEDMAEELTIGRNVAYELIRLPDFPSFTIGRRVLVSRKGLQEWIDAQCKKGPDAAVPTEASEP